MDEALDAVVDALDAVPAPVWGIGGMLLMCGLLLGFVFRSFYAKRQVWRAFAEAHGLEAQGLGYNEEPSVNGVYRGHEVAIGLGVVGRVRLAGKGTFEISDTVTLVRFGSPLPFQVLVHSKGNGAPEGARVDDPDFDVLSDDPASAAAWLRQAHVREACARLFSGAPRSAVDSEGASATFEAMPETVAELEQAVNQCLDCAQAIERS